MKLLLIQRSVWGEAPTHRAALKGRSKQAEICMEIDYAR